MKNSTNKNKEIFNSIGTKSLFDNLKSDHFLEKVFIIVQRRKSLEIVKYNNKIKKKLNLTIDNYKEYLEKYSSIEIELILAKN